MWLFELKKLSCLPPSYRTQVHHFSRACTCKFKYRLTQKLAAYVEQSATVCTAHSHIGSPNDMMSLKPRAFFWPPSFLFIYWCYISIAPFICPAFGWFKTIPNNMCWIFQLYRQLMQTYFHPYSTCIVHFIYCTRSFKPIFSHAPAPHVALIRRGPPKQIWWCFHQRPACDLGHLWLCSRPTTSKAFSYPSGLTDGNRWILVSSTRCRIRWLPDRYSRHMNCISRRSSSRPSTSLPWEPAV